MQLKFANACRLGRATHPCVPAARASAGVNLPAPVKFTEVMKGDTAMTSALIGWKDGSSWPMFLSPDALTQLQQFVDEPPHPRQPQLLVLVGPVKSGKSTVLHHILPAVVAQAYSAGGTPHPVIVRVTFNLRAPPAEAAMKLVENAAEAAARFGVTSAMPHTPQEALRRLDTILGTLAEGIEAQGGRLWLLLDECQVRPFTSFPMSWSAVLRSHCCCRRQRVRALEAERLRTSTNPFP
jgi:hypothetical protein